MSPANPTFDYASFTDRNSGFVAKEAQHKIRATTLMIAGCGVGSGTAICAVRLGFENFILVDGDTVSATNLNRQFFDFDDVGTRKVDALKKQILRINPAAKVEAVGKNLDSANTRALVRRADIVFDTVDFLDLGAILNLHQSAQDEGKPLFTALSAGFGALVWYFPPGTPYSLPTILQADIKTGQGNTYAATLQSFVQRLAPYMDEEVNRELQQVLILMQDNKPCPAPQVAPGSFGVAAMAMTLMVEFLSGRAIPESPSLLIHSFKTQQTRRVNILEQAV